MLDSNGMIIQNLIPWFVNRLTLNKVLTFNDWNFFVAFSPLACEPGTADMLPPHKHLDVHSLQERTTQAEKNALVRNKVNNIKY